MYYICMLLLGIRLQILGLIPKQYLITVSHMYDFHFIYFYIKILQYEATKSLKETLVRNKQGMYVVSWLILV